MLSYRRYPSVGTIIQLFELMHVVLEMQFFEKSQTKLFNLINWDTPGKKSVLSVNCYFVSILS